MEPKDDVEPLVPLALSAIAELLDTTEDKLPSGLGGVLLHFGIACHTEGWDRAHDEPTDPRLDTQPGFPAVTPSGTFGKKKDDNQR
jgi:hypothetical protein